MNKKMTVYILGKMLGVEGAVLLIPALVSLIYGEKSGFSFLIVGAVLGIIFLIPGKKKTEEYQDLRKGRLCDRRTGMDPVVPFRSAALLYHREYPELY